jgi:hypothetical protein
MRMDLWTRQKEAKPQRNGGPVAFPFAAESVRDPREPARAHADAQVGPFHNRGANALRIGNGPRLGPPPYWKLRAGNTDAHLPWRRGNLDEHGEVAAVPKGVRDRPAVRRESIGRNLELASRSVAQAFDENVRGGLVPLPHGDVQHQLAMALDCHEGVAVAKVRIIVGADAHLFLLDEAPDLIALA